MANFPSTSFEQLIYIANYLMHILNVDFSKKQTQYNLNFPDNEIPVINIFDAWILVLIDDAPSPGINVTTLAIVSRRDKTSFSPLLHRIKNAGLIDTSPDVQDLRIVNLTLSNKGKRCISVYRQQLAEVFSSFKHQEDSISKLYLIIYQLTVQQDRN